MLSKSLALLAKCLFYTNLHGGSRNRPFLIIPAILILLLTPLILCHSQTLKSNLDSIPFAPAVSYPVGGYPASICSGDFDGDGDIDLAVANTNDNDISVLMNNGDGTFQPAVDYPAGNWVHSIFCADLNGDGYPDLVVSNCDDNTISVFINKCDGTFKTRVNYDARDCPRNVSCADLNGDGYVDIAVPNYWGSGTVSVFINKGDGTFQPRVDYPAGQTPLVGIFCADLDGDSYVDIVVTSHVTAGTVSILKNNGNGTFQLPVSLPVGDYPHQLFCADLDGDLDLDIAVPNHGGGVSILKNNGNGTFQPKVDYPAGDGGPTDLFCADLDGDSHLDMAVGHYLNNIVSVLTNNGAGIFQQNCNLTAGDFTYYLTSADLDGDGDLDLAVANPQSNNVSILKNLTQVPANQPPWAFSLISPRDQDTSFIVVQFHWANAYDPNFGDQIRYDLFISTSSQFVPESTIIDSNLVISKHTDTLAIIDSCYWKVKAKDNWGAERWSTQTWRVVVVSNLIKDFTGEPTHGRKPLTVLFQPLCNAPPESVTLYFGDGDSSHLLNPVHKYTEFGNYDVKLVAELWGYKDSVTKEDYIRVSDIKAGFASDKRCGSAPLTVAFSDSSTGTYPIIAWHWDFGDSDTSNQQNPTHQFTSSGVFDVRLIVSDSIGSDTLMKQDYITTQDSMSADFFGLPNSGRSPLTVMFEPVLEGIANQYFWDFGDGDTSTSRNPIHIYDTQGKYNVKLIVRLELDDCNQVDSVIKGEYVSVHNLRTQFSADKTAGVAPLIVHFADSSSGNPNSWFWNFGDGNTSTQQNPQHQFDTAGVYDVFLRVSNALGQDSLLKLSLITVDTPYVDLYAELYGPDRPRPGFIINFYFVWTNIGTIPAENCTLKMLLPSQMVFSQLYDQSGSPFPGYYFVGDTIIAPLGTIDPSDWYGGYVYAHGSLPSSVPIGTVLVCKMWLTSSTLDRDYSNNYDSVTQVVIGSWDPNDKLASPEGEGISRTIEPDQRLAYTIQFENKPEATAEAIYIRVVDTLDQDLDWGSLAIGASSHPDKCHYEFDPYTGVIVWFCDSIMLPPNHNPPEGEGYFTYSISPKPNLVEGTEISNKAWIRFDYNPWLQAPEEGPVIRTIKYPFIYGDVNGDGVINVSDVVYLINYLFISGPAPQPLAAGDCNCDTHINVSDVVYLINYLFISGPPPGC